MTTAVVQTKYGSISGYDGSPSTPYVLTITLGSAVTSGNAVQISIVSSITSGGPPTAVTVTDDQGNTYTIGATQYWSGIPGAQGFAYTANITNGPSVFNIGFTFSASGTVALAAQVYEVSGLGTAPVIDLTVANTNGYGSGPWTNSFSTNYANEFALTINQDSGGPTLTTNWTDDSVNTGSVTFSHTNLSSLGSNSCVVSFATTQVDAYTLTTKPASSGPELAISQQGWASGSPPSITLGSVASGSVIIVTSQNDTHNASAETWSDNVNSGNYSLLADYTGGAEPGIFWIIANATGAPTITCSGSLGTVNATAFVVTGWQGTPTKDTSITAAWGATSAVLTATPLVTGQNNEILVAIPSYGGGAYGTGASTGWTISNSCPDSPAWDHGYAAYAIGVNAGASLPISAAISASTAWTMTIGGIYDDTSAATILTANYGSFALTGLASSLSISSTIALTLLSNPGAFNLLGAQSQSQSLLLASAGTFVLNGQVANFTKGLGAFSINCAYGTFSLTGENAILQSLTYTFPAFTGYFTLTGEAISFFQSFSGLIYPNVVGMDYYNAVEILTANGLQINIPILESVSTHIALPGTVLSQSVTPGLPLVPNIAVTLTVASEGLLATDDTQPISIYGPT